MTTKHSSIAALRRQAETCARTLKQAERGEHPGVKFGHKIAEARKRGSFRFGIVMDDKVITLDLPWITIRETTEAGLVEYIVGLMQERRERAH